MIPKDTKSTNIDSIMILCFSIMILLFITGGMNVAHPKFKLDLSQLDTFSWIFFILALIRKKISNSFFPEQITNIFEKIQNIFEQKNSKTFLYFSIIYLITTFCVITFRYQSFNANAYDLSYINQPIFNTAFGNFLYSSLAVNNTYLGEHFAPVLALLSPLYLIFNSIYALFLFTVILVALDLFIISKLCEAFQIAKSTKYLILSCFLLYQPLRAALNFDFREDHLFIPVFLSALLYFKNNKYLYLWILILSSFFIKENAAIFTALIGLWILFTNRKNKDSKRIHGLVIFLLSCVVFYIINTKITPHFSGTTQKTRFAFRMNTFGNTTSEFISFILTHPLTFLQYFLSQAINKSSIKYFLVVFIPFLICFRHSPFAFTIALFGFLLNVILGIQSIGYHYECIFIAFLFYAFIETLSKKPKLNPTTFGLILVGFLLFFGRSPVHYLKEFYPTSRDRMVESEIKKIPIEASIATTTALHPHLSMRKDAYLFAGAPTTDYVITDTHPSRNLYGTPNLESDIAQMSGMPYDLIVDRDLFKIWKKKN